MTGVLYIAVGLLLAYMLLRHLEVVIIALPMLGIISLLAGGYVYAVFYFTGKLPPLKTGLLTLLALYVVIVAVCGHFRPSKVIRKYVGPLASQQTVYVVQKLEQGRWIDDSVSPSVATQIAALFGKDKRSWRVVARTGSLEDVLEI